VQESYEQPSLGDLNYRAQRFLETDSKMSAILLVSDRRQRPLILKIARVDQRARAEVNREAIKNTVHWLQVLQPQRGLITMHALERRGESPLQSGFKQPAYLATLDQWPGAPECVVMEYIAGGSLSDFVGNQRLSVELAIWIAHHIARTLAYLHRRGCVHRDLKPENILFRTFPETTRSEKAIPILIDFGVAARAGAEKLVSGSRLWMAPELQEAYEQGPLPVDPAWDLYALALILCYLLTGRRPQRKQYDYQSYDSFREEAVARLERDAGKMTPAVQTALPRLLTLIAKTLDRRPENRPTAQEFVAETATLLADIGAPLPWHERLRMRLEESDLLPTVSRRQFQLAGGACFALLVLLALLFPALRKTLPASWTVTAPEPPSVYAVAAQEVNPPIAARLASLTPTATTTPASAATKEQGAIGTVAASPVAVATPLATEPPPTPADDNGPSPASHLNRPLATEPPPTLAPWTQTLRAETSTRVRPTEASVEAAPTLASLALALDEPAPTLAPLTPTPTPSPPPTPTPRATATARPSPTPGPTATRPVGSVQLLSPIAGASSSQPRIEFSWQISGQPLADDHCFELVFWDLQKSADKRSPVGAGKATRAGVNFTVLASSSDPLLHNLAQSRQPFHWGVRLVSCATPQQVLRDVEEARAYTYEGESR
jgi:hypothetical protein